MFDKIQNSFDQDTGWIPFFVPFNFPAAQDFLVLVKACQVKSGSIGRTDMAADSFDQDGVSGGYGVQVVHVRVPVFREDIVIITGSNDPGSFWNIVGTDVFAAAFDQFFYRICIPEGKLILFQAAVKYMAVRVDEPGNYAFSFKVYNDGGICFQPENLFIRTDRIYLVAGYRDRMGDDSGHSIYCAVIKNEVCHFIAPLCLLISMQRLYNCIFGFAIIYLYRAYICILCRIYTAEREAALGV